ncbi:pilus assembly protein Flp/PilA [Pseudomonas nitritireducens]|uniref:Pilus assembly protein Flp/PilA n=1 Tax=Pseudomonas nitroreducens TaxID=46680 RepID=A0A7W7P5Q5_PSENT|nr:Flp family type IVb pilin [Pseudomonas nitritireducens]MBB4868219.1 pilus assembly protein Flp/PilA [Pseudomonas nitritireducens]
MEKQTAVKQLPQNLYGKLKSFLRDREGATAIEYAVIAGLISIALLTAATPIGTKIGALMTAIKTAIGA